jgi:putative ABC transport system permease protein
MSTSPGSTRRERRLWGPDVRRDVQDEIAFHLEERARELRGRGLSPQAASEEAVRRFGNVTAVAASCRTIDERWYREQRRAGMWTDFIDDVSYSLRTLLRNRGFAATAILTLALGIGANTAIFSVMSSVLFRSWPFHEPQRLVFLWSSSETFPLEPLTPGRFVDFREQTTSFSGMAGISQISVNLTGGGEPERLAASSVSSSFFDVLGVPPLLGDPFHTGRAGDRDVVLSHGLWTRRFAADPGIIGRQIVLNGTACTVVAVMPPDFDWPAVTATPGTAAGPELWIPGTDRDIPRTGRNDANLAADRRAGYLRAVARLKEGASIESATHEAQAVAARLGQQYPEEAGRGASIVRVTEHLVGHLRRPMLILIGAVGFVLAIACANIASLLLGRGAARRREMAVRAALGASRARVIRQLLTESIVLAAAGAAVGVLVCSWVLNWLAAAAPAGLPGVANAVLDSRVLLFTAVLSIVTGLLCGIIPALQSPARSLSEDLGAGGARQTDSRRSGLTRDALVALEVAVALVLLIGAGLLLRSFHSLSRVDTGIDTRNLLTFDLFLSGERAADRQRRVAFFDAALQSIAAVPGVERAAAAATLPIGGDDFGTSVTIEGAPARRPGDEPRAGFQVVTPGYFDTMGIPVVRGRDFTRSDTFEAPDVVIVNETFARQHWAGQDPVGRRLRTGGGAWMTVVGLVRDIRHHGPGRPPRPELYRVHYQSSFPFMVFVVKTHANPAAAVPPIRGAIARLDAAQPISAVKTMEQHLETSLSRPKFMTALVTAFGVLALLLSVVGVYGVMAYSVTQRTREIAIRAALGATKGTVMRLIVSKAIWLTALGAAAGLTAAALLSTTLTGLLFGVSPIDASTYAAVTLLLGSIALLAATVPALRAARIPGAEVLRA